MKRISRRFVLKASAAGAGLGFLSTTGLNRAWAATPAMRYNAQSTQGKAMLKVYAQAVAKMMATPPDSPLSWTFQWYTHFTTDIDGNTKDKEIARIFKTGNEDNKALAEAMWDTCQAHNGQDENNFLPWHRMYVYYFEQIIRQVSGNPSFTLPYWDYTNATSQAIPEEFRKKDDPVYGALYRANRAVSTTGSVNEGVSIVTVSNPNAPESLNLEVMQQTDYASFNQQLDRAPHGLVHNYTGDETNMGNVPTAAGDPVFWLHHCNIDRIWAGWNAAGNKNFDDEAWKNTKFTFANTDGKRVDAAIGDFLDVAALNYSYDALPKPPPSGLQMAKRAAASVQAPTTLLTAKGAQLSVEPLRVKLAAVGAAAAPPSVKSVAGKRRMYLRISDVSAKVQPAVVYNIYLDLPAGQAPTAGSPHYMGTLSFFDAVPHGRHAGHTAKKEHLFDITTRAAKLKAQGKLSETPTLTLMPTGKPRSESNPTIGDISLVVR